MNTEYKELTDAQCDEIRRHPGSFNDMLRTLSRAAWLAASAAEREAILQALPGGSWCDPQQVADMIRARGAAL